MKRSKELEYIENEIINKQREINTYYINHNKPMPILERDKAEKELAILESIKAKLQAFEIMKNKVIIRADNNELTITNGLKNNTIIKLITNEEQETLVKAFKEEKKYEQKAIQKA